MTDGSYKIRKEYKMLHQNRWKENQWRISQDKENSWNWKLMSPSGEVLESSAREYKTRVECLENARRHGYLGY